MKGKWIILCLGLVLATWAQGGGREPVYVFGVVPQFDAATIHRVWRPILDRLEARTGLHIILRGSPSIPEFEQQFLNGVFDFAYMNPYHMLIARDRQGYLPLVRDHGETLHGVLVVRDDSPLRSPAELDGERVAFPSPNALGASLQIRAALQDRFHVRVRPLYVNTHSSVFLNVALGRVAAGGGVQKTLARQPAAVRDRLRVLYRTEAVSPHPVSAHPRVPERVREKVRDALLEMGRTEPGRGLLQAVPIARIGPASMTDYLPLAEMQLERFYVP